MDLANDVVIDGDVAWIVGMSKGKHDDTNSALLRGILVPMNLHTGKPLAGPVSRRAGRRMGGRRAHFSAPRSIPRASS
jgi:hypothetical protein